MLSNRLQTFTNNSHCFKIQEIKHEVQTSDTLTDVNVGQYFRAELYWRYNATEVQLLQHTFGHRQVWKLERLLEDVYQEGNKRLQSSELISNSNTNIINLNQLAQSSQKALNRIVQLRKSLRQKLQNHLLLKSKETHKKTVLKQNLQKCRDTLTVLKNLHNKEFNTQQQIMQFKYRLQTSGLILVPSLIEKSLVGLVCRVLKNRKNRVSIVSSANLNTVVEVFLDNQGAVRDLWNLYFVGEFLGDWLFAKFKIFILLKTYIDDGQQGALLRKLFQQKIKDHLLTNLPKITNTEHHKIMSIVQCDENLQKFWHKISQNQIEQSLKKVLSLTEKLQKRKTQIISLMKQQITKNKNVKDRNKFKINGSKIDAVLSSDLFPSIQEIKEIVVGVEERIGFFNVCAFEFDVPRASDVIFLISFACLKILLFPLQEVNMLINGILHRDKRQKHYHNYRFIHRSLKVWQKLFGELQQKSLQVIEQTKNAVNQLQNRNPKETPKQTTKIPTKTSMISTVKKNPSDCHQQISIGELYINYNNQLGQRFFYACNKLILSLKNTTNLHAYKDREESSIKMRQNTEQLKIEDFAQLWVQLVTDKLSDHLLYELQPANILKNIQIFQQEILELLENQHKVQNQLNKLEKEIQNHLNTSNKEKIKLSETKIQQIHAKILQLNMRTRNYEKLLKISKIIKIDEQIRSMNESIYQQVFKKKIK